MTKNSVLWKGKGRSCLVEGERKKLSCGRGKEEVLKRERNREKERRTDFHFDLRRWMNVPLILWLTQQVLFTVTEDIFPSFLWSFYSILPWFPAHSVSASLPASQNSNANSVRNEVEQRRKRKACGSHLFIRFPVEETWHLFLSIPASPSPTLPSFSSSIPFITSFVLPSHYIFIYFPPLSFLTKSWNKRRRKDCPLNRIPFLWTPSLPFIPFPSLFSLFSLSLLFSLFSLSFSSFFYLLEFHQLLLRGTLSDNPWLKTSLRGECGHLQVSLRGEKVALSPLSAKSSKQYLQETLLQVSPFRHFLIPVFPLAAFLNPSLLPFSLSLSLSLCPLLISFRNMHPETGPSLN